MHNVQRLGILIVLAAFAGSATGRGQSLDELAKKEKERRKQNAEAGHKPEKFTNVGADDDPDEPPPGTYRFDNLGAYENALAERVASVKPLEQEWKELWLSCSAAAYRRVEAIYAPSGGEWWMFTIPSFRRDVVGGWSRDCRECYDELWARFARAQTRYDKLYREYLSFASDRGQLSRVQARKIPSPN